MLLNSNPALHYPMNSSGQILTTFAQFPRRSEFSCLLAFAIAASDCLPSPPVHTPPMGQSLVQMPSFRVFLAPMPERSLVFLSHLALYTLDKNYLCMCQLYKIHEGRICVHFEAATCQACPCPPSIVLPTVLSLVLSLPALCSPWASNLWSPTTFSIWRGLILGLQSQPISRGLGLLFQQPTRHVCKDPHRYKSKVERLCYHPWSLPGNQFLHPGSHP